ncbi:polysaccharide biosynthesis tyrosine autokinase [Alloacidobacterium dinghuense]|uniref:Polysaccharide biosynthesis tyrosine autokinase n=1 Tax=Alloacidobacterium dinghuense TaxID=2763107 RepID=A0A7G8BDY8_9BACT|nr:polysaccharide biosynthesis tyrosine autokinase [Alloacidobacterium dinghuense]QNI30758.1 polysaccharide biosynthesis tyrosine autokinase [Alloacidobacterium dinghuense]
MSFLTQNRPASRTSGVVFNAPIPEGPGIPSGPSEIGLSDLVRILRRRIRIIIAAVVIVFVLGSLYCVVKTRRYEATSDLAIYPEGSDALDMGDITASIGGGGLDFDEKLETQVRILKSNSLAWTVISQLRLDKEPTFAGRRKYILFGPYVTPDAPAQIDKTSPERQNQLLGKFRKSLTVQSIARTQAVEITFRDANPILAREVVNRLSSAYAQRNFVTRFNNTMKASDWLSGQLDQLKSRVEESQVKLAKFQKETGIFGTDENDNLVLSKLDDLSKELTDAEADRIVKEAKYRVAQSGNPELIGTIVPDSVLPVLRSQEADLKNQLALASTEFGPHYPKVIQLQNQMAQLEKALHKEVADIQERFRTDYEASAVAEKQLRASFDQQKQKAYDMSEGLSEYGILKREVESGSDLYEDLLKKLKEAGVVASLKAATIDVIDPATLPTRPVEPNIPLTLALSIFLGLGSGVGLAFLAENLDNTIRSTEDIEFLTTIPVFGWVPHFKMNQNSRLKGASSNMKAPFETEGVGPIVLLRPNSQVSEAFRSLRTALLLTSARMPPKTILITSALPGDGKTTVTVNLASVLAQQGARVLLVDADLRRGLIAEQLNIPQNFGLSGSLAGAGIWRDAVANLPEAPHLDILQSGLRPPNSADLLGSSKMHELLEDWRAEYDHVIIDSSPCLAITDGVLVAQKTDTVLLVSRIGHTPRASLRRVSELLQSSNVHVAGIVINDVGMADDYYGYAYSKYSAYYAEDEKPN